jgi:hypothetical protein
MPAGVEWGFGDGFASPGRSAGTTAVRACALVQGDVEHRAAVIIVSPDVG